ncbi:MAG: glycosyltransferase family 39 protein [Anaerolineae bacterium]|nr:glycosyltransferase family 39 protein [Anaerolineae bacterium]
MRSHSFLLLLVLAFLLVGAMYADRIPAWQAPDEPAHYNYVRQLAAGTLPVIEAQDYDELYRDRIVSERFPPDLSIEPLTYEDWQPPLYYLLLTPVFRLTEGSLFALRLVTLLIGAALIWMAYNAASELWPRHEWLALTAAAFVAFLPQHVAGLATVNNDSLAELIIAAILWLLLRGARRPAQASRQWPLVGALLGLGFLTKATVYLMAPVVLFALWCQYRGRAPAFWRASVKVSVPALPLGAMWWVRNLIVYGDLDVLGKAAHDRVVVGQLRTADWVAQSGLGPSLRQFAVTTFQSFWGQFGWMGVVMDRWVYAALAVFSALIILGLTIAWGRAKWDETRKQQTLLLVLTVLASIALYLGYNLTFVQAQGRYLFPALIPIACGVALGLTTWLRLLIGSRSWLHWLLPVGLSLGLIGLDLLALFRYIVPQLRL